MKSHIWGWWMIGERLDVLPDVLPHRPAINDLSATDCVTSPCTSCGITFSATNKILVDQESSRRLTVSRLLGGSPNIYIWNKRWNDKKDGMIKLKSYFFFPHQRLFYRKNFRIVFNSFQHSQFLLIKTFENIVRQSALYFSRNIRGNLLTVVMVMDGLWILSWKMGGLSVKKVENPCLRTDWINWAIGPDSQKHSEHEQKSKCTETWLQTEHMTDWGL